MEVFVESKMMQMISPSQDNPAYAGNTGTNAGIPSTAPKKP